MSRCREYRLTSSAVRGGPAGTSGGTVIPTNLVHSSPALLQLRLVPTPLRSADARAAAVVVAAAVDDVGPGQVAHGCGEDVHEAGEGPHREEDHRGEGVQLEAQRSLRHEL